MSKTFTIYHNPRCSKSRQTLKLLEDNGTQSRVVKVIEYLETPPSASKLKQLVKALGIKPRELLRKGEAEYKALGLADPTLSDKDLIEAMINHPKLIERPIVVCGDRAVLGRPPENIKALLDE